MSNIGAFASRVHGRIARALERSARQLASASFLRPCYVRTLRQRYSPLRLVIGAGGTSYEGWLSSNYAAEPALLPHLGQLDSASMPLDITVAEQWARLFDECTVARMLSEHVFEHLSHEQLEKGFALCRQYLEPGGRLRIAVPDGHRPDARYIDAVSPPVDGHKQLFTIESLTCLLEGAGFEVVPLEYYDSSGKLNRHPYDEADGIVLRCFARDRQVDFAYADHHYTSIIVDAVRPGG